MRKTKKLFDCRCAELAVHFLQDEWAQGDDVAKKQAEVDSLAAHIQQSVEDWFTLRTG